MAKVRILISDNSKDFVWLLVQHLSKYPELEIIGAAYDGRQTIEMIEQTTPDVVLLDLIMPGTNGLQVIERIRKINTPVKIFVLSAIGDDKLIEMVMDYGADKYFVKPLDICLIASALLSEG